MQRTERTIIIMEVILDSSLFETAEPSFSIYTGRDAGSCFDNFDGYCWYVDFFRFFCESELVDDNPLSNE